MDLNEIYKNKTNRLIAGGCHTYSRGNDQYPLNAPSVLERGEGCYVWDVNGNKYLDYGMALRAVTVGYGYDRIAKAAIAQIYKGNNLTRASKVEVDAAEAMLTLIEGMDIIKFAKNGSTVTTAATKLARAYTGRKYILRCADHPFFSYDDWFIGDTIMNRGIPEEIRGLTLNFKYNDLDSARKVFHDHPSDIACVILEPATHVEPTHGFLQELKTLCHENGAVFILDEMITGFRWHLGGAQRYYGVTPDLCTFGKGMANGFSVAALLGKKEIMELGGIEHQNGKRVFLASTTHGAEMSSLGALLETIEVYKEMDVIGHLWQYGAILKDGVRKLTDSLAISEYFYFEGTNVSPNFVCKNQQKEVSLSFRTLFLQEMIKHGVLMPYVALSYSHTNKEMQITLDAMEKSLKVYKSALENGIDMHLAGRSIKPVFREVN